MEEVVTFEQLTDRTHLDRSQFKKCNQAKFINVKFKGQARQKEVLMEYKHLPIMGGEGTVWFVWENRPLG